MDREHFKNGSLGCVRLCGTGQVGQGKVQIEEVILMVETNPEFLNHKRLEHIWGFLQYITQTYSGMTPYIIGFHLTIDGWLENRLTSGWRMKEAGNDKTTKQGRKEGRNE
jgi:hypothetical protein